MLPHVAALLAPALDLVLPPRCPACRDIVPEAGRFCGNCFAELSFLTPPWCDCCGLPFDIEAGDGALCGACMEGSRPYRTARAALRYQGSAVPVLLGFKHGGRTHLARVMAAQMSRLLAEMPDADLLVPVPLDRRRLRRRGYNQAGLIARALARAANKQVAVDAMQRVKATVSTAGMSRAARFRSAQGAFSADGTRVAGRRVVLVDDVMTTGATAESAARALKKAGAASVDVLTFARALGNDN